MNDRDAMCRPADVGYRGQSRTLHGAQHSPRERIARERCEQVAVAGIDRYLVADAADDCCCIAVDVAPLTEQGCGAIARIERHMDYLGALGDEYLFVGVSPRPQLRLGEAAEDFHSGVVE